MWAAINIDNRECTLYVKERDALMYVALKIAHYDRYSRVHPSEMNIAALRVFVSEHEGDDKAWVVTDAWMGKPGEAEEGA